MTRSWNAAAHGHLGRSVEFHPVGPLAMLSAAAIAAGLDERVPLTRTIVRSRTVAWSLAAAWIVVWLLRIRTALRSRPRDAVG